LAVSKYFETLRKHAVHVRRKIDVTVPNDSHTIVHCNYDRDVLGKFLMEVDYNSKKSLLVERPMNHV
jgi:hypothetical protein